MKDTSSSWLLSFDKEKIKAPFNFNEWINIYILGEINWYPTIKTWWKFKEETSFFDHDSEALDELTWFIFSNIKLLSEDWNIIVNMDNASLETDYDWIYDDDWDYPELLTWIKFAEAIDEISSYQITIRNEWLWASREHIQDMLWENFKLIITE